MICGKVEQIDTVFSVIQDYLEERLKTPGNGDDVFVHKPNKRTS